MVYFINDKFISEEAATIHVSDLSIQRGYALFDFLRTKNNVPLFINDYLDRFYRSSQLLQLTPPKDRDALKHIIYELVRINNIPEAGFKIILTGGYSTDGYASSIPNLIITQTALKMPEEAMPQKGVKIITYEYLRQLPSIKSTNYLMGVLLQSKVKQHQAEDVLYYTSNSITELPRANFFIVTQEDILVTPNDDILEGITRMKVLELANTICKVEKRPVTLQEVYNAKEAFITSTTKRIQPVIQIDETIINEGKTGKLTTGLYKAFIALENEYINHPSR